MARRPVYCPVLTGNPFVKEVLLDFEWHSGFAKSQAQKSIISLHDEANRLGLGPALEISTKADSSLGVELSAFNLKLVVRGKSMTVEAAFQGSKAFQNGGPFHDLYDVPSRDAKKDERIRENGPIVAFDLLGESWPIRPQTCFYDWLYLNALVQNPNVSQELLNFNAFSDIAFNPAKSINCQARSAAVFVALSKLKLIDKVTSDRNEYLSTVGGMTDSHTNQQRQRVLFSEI
jgi:hypothetical protein